MNEVVFQHGIYYYYYYYLRHKKIFWHNRIYLYIHTFVSHKAEIMLMYSEKGIINIGVCLVNVALHLFLIMFKIILSNFLYYLAYYLVTGF